MDETTRKGKKLLKKGYPESFNFTFLPIVDGTELKVVGGLDYVVEKINARFMEHYGVPY